MRMNNLLRKVIMDTTPPLSDYVTDGATLNDSIQYLDGVIRGSLDVVSSGLTYHGYHILTPQEDLNTTYKNTTMATKPFDTSRSSIYKVAFNFKYKNVPLKPVYIYMPYTEEAGIMTISDTKYHVIQIYNDTILSHTNNGVFVRLLRDKLTFKRTYHNMLRNGNIETGEIVYSHIYTGRGAIKEESKTSPVPPAVMYVVSKYGIGKTLEKYCGVKDIIITDNISDIPDGYDTYSSIGISPIKKRAYVPHTFMIAIPSGNHKSVLVSSIMSGVFYSLDRYPNDAMSLLKVIKSGRKSLEITIWKGVMSNLIFKEDYTSEKKARNIEVHYQTLMGYVDHIIKKKLSELDIYVDDFFDLLMVIITKFKPMVLASKTRGSNLKDRYLDSKYYMLYKTIVSVNTAIFEISHNYGSSSELTVKEVEKPLAPYSMKPKQILGTVKGSETNLAILLADYSGDNKYFKLTATASLQELGDGVSRGKGKGKNYPEHLKVVSGLDMFLGSIYALTKKTPSPALRLNPFAKFDTTTGRPILSEEDIETIKSLDAILDGRVKSDVTSNIGVDITDANNTTINNK